MTDAYAAGLVDGEGCLTITKDQRKGLFYVRIDLGMSLRSLGLLNGLKAEYGGTVRMFREATERWEEAHVWRAFGKVAANMLIRISPYLQLKTEQARLCLCLQEMVDALPRNPNGSAQWTSEVRQKAEALHLLVSELNHKGSRSQPKPGWFARVVGDYLVTPQQDLFSDLGYTIYCETFPESGFMQDGFVYELATSGPVTSESVYLSSDTWPTHTQQSGTQGTTGTHGVTLIEKVSNWPTEQAEHWPTPKAACPGSHPNGLGGKILEEEARLWSGDRKDEPGLDQQARMFPKNWPTPNAQDEKQRQTPESAARQVGKHQLGMQEAACLYSLPAPQIPDGPVSSETFLGSRQPLRRRLNVEFVTWLMGFPAWWMSLDD